MITIIGYIIGAILCIGGFIWFLSVLYALLIEPFIGIFRRKNKKKNKSDSAGSSDYLSYPSPLNNWHLWH